MFGSDAALKMSNRNLKKYHNLSKTFTTGTTAPVKSVFTHLGLNDVNQLLARHWLHADLSPQLTQQIGRRGSLLETDTRSTTEYSERQISIGHKQSRTDQKYRIVIISEISQTKDLIGSQKNQI